MDQQNKSSIGSVIATIIIIAIIILGGLYFWGKRVEESKATENLVSGTSPTSESSEATAIKSMSSSDDLNSIDADLKATNLDNLAAEANASAQ
jgi:hypothetical protein